MDKRDNELTEKIPSELDQLYREMMNQVDIIMQENSDGLTKTKLCLEAILKILEKVREYILSHPFADNREEISFFKVIKPKFYSEYIYYSRIYRIEILRPTGGYEDELNYLLKELKRLNDFFQANLAFYQYFRTDSEFMDETYFVRSSGEKTVMLDHFSPDADPRFCTSHDYKVSRILANERLKIYLNTTLDILKRNEGVSSGQGKPDTLTTWTAPKSALIELIYALQSFGAFNYGRAEIKDIADLFERTFNINLGNLYRTFQEIRIRKKGRIYFLDQLREQLIKRMDHADENPR